MSTSWRAGGQEADFSPPKPEVLEGLKEIVGAEGWRAGRDAEGYFDDPRGRFLGQARLVLRPNSTQQVSAILRLCNENSVGVIPYGGGSGVVAGQLSPQSAEAVILSLDRMNRVREVCLQDFAIVVEAGCILENIHAEAARHGMTFPLSMASKGSCTIGGNLATNAGGIQVLRHGNTRDLCLGIEAVLPNGEVLRELSPLRKNNTGYDLRHLFIGSEGTLGVITAATLVLKPIEPETVTVLMALSGPESAMRVFSALRERLGKTLNALELMSGFGLGLVRKYFPEGPAPFVQSHGWYLLAEISGTHGTDAQAEAAFEALFDAGLFEDALVAVSEAQRQALWDLRENTPEANRQEGAICSSDTSVPISKIDQFIAKTHAAIFEIDPDLRVNSYGHIGDGNIHHNVFPPAGVAKADFIDANPLVIDTVRRAISDVTVECGGAISAEHGIGRLKVDDLLHYSSAAKLTAFRQIKNALDPNGIMNPGALIR